MRAISFISIVATFLLSAAPSKAFDTNWKQISPGELADLQLEADNLRINNFVVREEKGLMYGRTPIIEFTATAVNKSDNNRYVSLQLIGLNESGGAILAISARPIIPVIQAGKSADIKDTMLINEGDLKEVKYYLLRIIVRG